MLLAWTFVILSNIWEVDHSFKVLRKKREYSIVKTIFHEKTIQVSCQNKMGIRLAAEIGASFQSGADEGGL